VGESGLTTLVLMFRGANPITLDAKGRMAMPTRYRERIAQRCENQMVITIDRDHCLLLYPLPDWEEIEHKLMRLPSLNRTVRELQRLMVGHAAEVELDGQGRILLPPDLRQFASLTKDAVLLGQGARFELWDEARWTERRDSWLQSEHLTQNLPAELESLAL